MYQFKQTTFFYKFSILLLYVVFMLNGITLWLISDADPYKGLECQCALINFHILNSTENGVQNYQVHYSLFCPETMEEEDMFLRSYESWDDAHNYMQYVSNTSDTVECCVDEKWITDDCKYNFYGAMGYWFIILGLAIPSSIWMCTYFVIYEADYKVSKIFKKSSIGGEQVQIEMQRLKEDEEESQTHI